MPPPALRPRTALVVAESMFGNTHHLARAVADGLRSEGVETLVLDVGVAAPPEVVRVDLLVLGAPTHAGSLSDATTRADAVRQGADADRMTRGLREWLVHAHPDTMRRPQGLDVAAFECRAHRLAPGVSAHEVVDGAAPSALAMARLQGFRTPTAAEIFYVTDPTGPLAPGELQRAGGWGRTLAGARIGV